MFGNDDDDDDDKYAKASRVGGPRRASVEGFTSPPPSTQRRSRRRPERDGIEEDVDDLYDGNAAARRASVSAHATPTSYTRSRFNEGYKEDDDDDRVRGALDRLAFSNALNQVTDAFGAVLDDAADEATQYANKASEALTRFQASQYASQYLPIESAVSMRPTYVKVPAQTVEQLKFWESDDVRAMKMEHLREKQVILQENAGLRAMVGEDAASESVQEVRETEDGVNRALLLAAVEEITNLKTRVAVLETERAKARVSSSGFGIGGMFGGGEGASGGGVDQAQIQKMTREMARLEENNSRMTWMLGEKEKQIKETRAKFTESAAYALEEKLQECMEALEVASHLQGEQLQYLETHALAKLEALDDRLVDVQVSAESKTEHLKQLRTIMERFFVDGDESSVSVLTSLTGFKPNEGKRLVEARNSRGITGMLNFIGKRLTPAVSAAGSMIIACAPPASSVPGAAAALKTLGVELDDDDAQSGDKEKVTDDANAEEPTSSSSSTTTTTTTAPEETKRDEEDEELSKPTMTTTAEQPSAGTSKPAPPKPTTTTTTRSKTSSKAFAGFEDPALEEKKKAERAKSRQPLPQPKLVGRAAARERAKRDATTRSSDSPAGFAGFGDDPDASSDDDN